MKCKLLILLLLVSSSCFTQTIIIGTVKDCQTKQPLAYCNVYFTETKKGTITNADGLFCISADTIKGALEFSYLGYEAKTIFVSDWKNNKIVLLQKNIYELPEIEIHADNDYLYDILIESQNKLQKNKSEHVSKAYYAIETKAHTLDVCYPDTKTKSLQKTREMFDKENSVDKKEKTIELLECLYNASISGSKITNLKFRNGKVFSLPAENYFFSLNTSTAMSQFCFFEKNEIFPSCPFQYKKRNMKKIFDMKLLSFDGNNYHIAFYPYDNSKKYFSGDVWIEKQSKQVLKITLMIDSAEVFPFVPPSFSNFNDTIKNFNLYISNSYNPTKEFLPDHTVFEYSFTYVSRKDTIVLKSKYKNTITDIKSKGLIYYYDYKKPFVLPYFTYDFDFYDYYLLALFPYNRDLWETNNIVQLTESQKTVFGIGEVNNSENHCLIKDGQLCLKDSDPYIYSGIGVFLFHYIFWSEDKRVILSKTSIMDEITKDVQQTPYPDQLYNIEVQILLDVTEVGDSIVCKSWTVFDTMKSFYKYEETEFTRAFLNIYFDICEIERQKMQEMFSQKQYSLKEIDEIYNATKAKLERIKKQYCSETDRGRDEKTLKKWNKYVFENLGIDNLELVRNTEKK